MRKIIYLMLLISFLSACSSESNFEKYMREGKIQLINEQYEEALKNFKYALIEEPQNEDAKILYEQSLYDLSMKEASILLSEYENRIEPILNDYTPLLNKYINYKLEKDKIISLDYLNAMDKLSELISSTESISYEYKSNDIIYKLNNLILDSMETLYEKMSEPKESIFKLIDNYPKDKMSEYEIKLDEIKKYN